MRRVLIFIFTIFALNSCTSQTVDNQGIEEVPVNSDSICGENNQVLSILNSESVLMCCDGTEQTVYIPTGDIVKDYDYRCGTCDRIIPAGWHCDVLVRWR